MTRGRRRDSRQESVTPHRITNIHFRQRIFILHVCITAGEFIPYVTLIGTPTRYMFA